MNKNIVKILWRDNKKCAERQASTYCAFITLWIRVGLHGYVYIGLYVVFTLKEELYICGIDLRAVLIFFNRLATCSCPPLKVPISPDNLVLLVHELLTFTWNMDFTYYRQDSWTWIDPWTCFSIHNNLTGIFANFFSVNTAATAKLQDKTVPHTSGHEFFKSQITTGQLF